MTTLRNGGWDIMKVGLQRAAELTGKSRSTIQRAIKSGKLSAEENESGKKVVDVAELEQVYGLVKPEKKPANVTSEEQPTSQLVELQAALERARQKAAVEAEHVEKLKEELAKLKEDRDYWHRQANRLLNEQRQEAEQKVEAGLRNPISWFNRLLGRQRKKGKEEKKEEQTLTGQRKN
jgi:polyhydroxyalkanoate synthesis regulator phasin